MIQSVEELRSKLKSTSLGWPFERHRFCEGDIQVRLSGTINNTCRTVSKSCCNTVCSDDRSRRKADRVKVGIQVRVNRTAVHQLSCRAGPAEVRTVLTDSEGI